MNRINESKELTDKIRYLEDTYLVNYRNVMRVLFHELTAKLEERYLHLDDELKELIHTYIDSYLTPILYDKYIDASIAYFDYRHNNSEDEICVDEILQDFTNVTLDMTKQQRYMLPYKIHLDDSYSVTRPDIIFHLLHRTTMCVMKYNTSYEDVMTDLNVVRSIPVDVYDSLYINIYISILSEIIHKYIDTTFSDARKIVNNRLNKSI